MINEIFKHAIIETFENLQSIECTQCGKAIVYDALETANLAVGFHAVYYHRMARHLGGNSRMSTDVGYSAILNNKPEYIHCTYCETRGAGE